MFRFANEYYFYLLLLLPVLIFLYLIAFYYKKRAIKSFGDLSVISQLMPDVSVNRPVIKFSLLLIALSAVIIAISRPQFGSKLKEVKRKGVEIVLALDVSNSMMAEDIQPNRLERAKQAISMLVDDLSNDRIGLIVFAGDAYTQLPITSDYASAKMFLSSISTDIVPRQGTAIASAIELGMNSFSPDNEKDKAMIIITDGENHEGDALTAAKAAAEKNITIHTIGVGSTKGAPIPVNKNYYGQKVFRKDRQGNVVMSKLNVTMLNQISAAGEGKTIIASNSKLGLKEIYKEINKMDKQEIETKIYSDYDDKFQYFIAIALFFLFIEYIIINKKNRQLKNFSLFKINN